MISKVGNGQYGLLAKFLAIDGRVNAVQTPVVIFPASEVNCEFENVSAVHYSDLPDSVHFVN